MLKQEYDEIDEILECWNVEFPKMLESINTKILKG